MMSWATMLRRVCLAGSALALIGCASGPSERAGEKPGRAEERGSAPSGDQFGEDPMGAARQWVANLPESAPSRFRDGVADWSSPLVARIYRRTSESYRAVVLPRDQGEVRGLLVAVEREGEEWSVEPVEWVDGSRGWTSY